MTWVFLFSCWSAVMVPTASMHKSTSVAGASKLCGAGPSLEHRRAVVQHYLADDLDGRKALAHEVVVKAFQRKGCTLALLHIGSQFHDLQLAECVVEIKRIGST